MLATNKNPRHNVVSRQHPLFTSMTGSSETNSPNTTSHPATSTPGNMTFNKSTLGDTSSSPLNLTKNSSLKPLEDNDEQPFINLSQTSPNASSHSALFQPSCKDVNTSASIHRLESASLVKLNVLRISHSSSQPWIFEFFDTTNREETQFITVYPPSSKNKRSRVLAAISILREYIVIHEKAPLSEADPMDICKLLLKDIMRRHAIEASYQLLKGTPGSKAREVLRAFYDNQQKSMLSTLTESA